MPKKSKSKSKAKSKRTRQVARKSRKTYHHGDTRAALIEAATDLIYKHGVSGFSLREAARQVGVDPTASYRHFRDRGEILIAVAQQGFILLSEMYIVDEKLGSRSRIEELGHQYLHFARTYPAHFRLMFGECGIPTGDPRMRAPELQSSPSESLAESLDAWAEANGHELDVERTALLLWAGVHGLARLDLDGAVPLDREIAHVMVLDLVKSVLGSATSLNAGQT